MTGFTLTPDDIAIFKLVYDFRMATIDHLSALTSRPPKRLHRRILKLIGEGYLARRVLPAHKHIYTIGAAAIPILVEQGTAADDALDARLRHGELKDFFLQHELFISDIHAALSLATRTHHIHLTNWRQGHELFDSVKFFDKGKKYRLPVRPDAFFTLEDTTRRPDRNRVHFFLEADRSTATHTRFADKITAYHRYFEGHGHEQKHGIKTFRVVTITLTPERAANLCDMTRLLVPPAVYRFYLFSSANQFSLSQPSAILSDIFITPHSEGETAYLVPPTTQVQ